MPVSPFSSAASRRRLLIGAAAVPLAPCALWLSDTAHAASASFDAALRERLAREGVGLAAVQVSPAGIKLLTLGVMRQGSAAPITDQTVFELGSMTKAFVALLLADGVLTGRWTLGDPVEDGLPDGLKLRDATGQPLRLIDLATHRSGLPRMPANLAPKEMANPYPYYTEARLFAFLRQWQPVVARGERFEYSNLGYGLLSQVLARRAGLSLDGLMAERIFKPLGIMDLQIRRPLPTSDNLAEIGAALTAQRLAIPREATGHDAQRRPVSPWQFDVLAGAVGLVGPITSVGRFIQAAVGLFDHPLQSAFAMCLQSRTEGEHPLHPFGLAWELSPISTRKSQRMLFNQDGATGGFSTSLWLEPARRTGAAVLSNAFVETRELALQGLDNTISVDDFSLTELPRDMLDPLAGSYRLNARFTLDVRSRDDRLWAQSTGQPEFELLPSAPRRFFARHAALEVTFDDTARPSSLTVLRDGQRLLFTRQP